MNKNWHYRPAWVQLALWKDMVGLEVGVAKGTNARYMLSNLSIKKLYLIDPYFKQSDEFDGAGERPYIEGTEHPDAQEIAKKVLKSFEDKLEWLVGTTEEMIETIEDYSLDFCYIDGCHEYEAVMKDIELCSPKVKHCGILGGHDFVNDHPGVVKAVLKNFCRDDIFVSNRDWWTIKFGR